MTIAMHTATNARTPTSGYPTMLVAITAVPEVSLPRARLARQEGALDMLQIEPMRHRGATLETSRS